MDTKRILRHIKGTDYGICYDGNKKPEVELKD